MNYFRGGGGWDTAFKPMHTGDFVTRRRATDPWQKNTAYPYLSCTPQAT